VAATTFACCRNRGLGDDDVADASRPMITPSSEWGIPCRPRGRPTGARRRGGSAGPAPLAAIAATSAADTNCVDPPLVSSAKKSSLPEISTLSPWSSGVGREGHAVDANGRLIGVLADRRPPSAARSTMATTPVSSLPMLTSAVVPRRAGWARLQGELLPVDLYDRHVTTEPAWEGNATLHRAPRAHRKPRLWSAEATPLR